MKKFPLIIINPTCLSVIGTGYEANIKKVHKDHKDAIAVHSIN